MNTDPRIIKLSKIELSNDNILGLVESHSYRCSLWGYQPGHSVFFIKIERENQSDTGDTFYLCFEEVEYFEGTTQWHGANFRIAALDECQKLLKRIEKYKAIPSAFLPLHLSLLTVDTSDITIKIVASKVTLTRDISSWNAG